MSKKLRKLFFALISYRDNELDISKVRYLPRWVVLLLDLFIVTVSFVICHFILRELSVLFYEVLSLTQQIFVVVGIQLIFFLLLKTYAGLIRHSSSIDAIKLLLSTSGTLLTLITINVIHDIFYGSNVFLTFGLLLNTFITFTLLYTFRIFVKRAYEYFKSVKFGRTQTKTVIFGVSEGAISIASALDMEHITNYEVVGFLSRKNSNTRLRVLDKPVISCKEDVVPELKKQEIGAVIFPEDTFDTIKEDRLVEDFLNNNIKILKTPQLSNWVEGKSVSNALKSVQIEDLLNRNLIALDNKKTREQIRESVILVTGGAGSIGSEIVRQIASFKPKMVVVLDQAETPLHNLSLELNEEFPDIYFEYFLGDVRNEARLRKMFELFKIEFVYHAAAYKHVPLVEDNPNEGVLVNIRGTKLLADLSLEFGVRHFVMVSTDKAVNPTNVMGASKRAAELYVQSLFFEHSRKPNATKFITTRFGNVLGSNGSVVPLFKKQIAQGGPITITHPDIIRYFMTISEACQLVLEAGTMGKGGEIFVFDMGSPVKIKDLAHKMVQLAGYEPGKDIEIKYTGLRPGEKLYEELLNDESTVRPTHNKKIMIAVDLERNYKEVSKQVDVIIDKSINDSGIVVVRELKKLVVNFRSNNSVFEELDVRSVV